MSDSEHVPSQRPEPAPAPPRASAVPPDAPREVPSSSARGSGDEAAPTAVDRQARQRPKLPVSDALARRLGGGRMPGKADRRAPRR